jgi:uncharacterized membrane protein
MATGSTKPPGATSFKQTAFGIIPRDELLKLELEGTKNSRLGNTLWARYNEPVQVVR